MIQGYEILSNNNDWPNDNDAWQSQYGATISYDGYDAREFGFVLVCLVLI